jgi:hypothetical protein
MCFLPTDLGADLLVEGFRVLRSSVVWGQSA